MSVYTLVLGKVHFLGSKSREMSCISGYIAVETNIDKSTIG